MIYLMQVLDSQFLEKVAQAFVVYKYLKQL